MKIYQVGGSVRDEILGKAPKDYDYVVVGSTVQEMLDKGFKQVGNDFPVFLHPETGDEYALARMERKTGDKHTDFEFEFGPNVTLQDDLIRRDLTINAIAKDLVTGEYIDYFNGIKDLKDGILRHVSEHFIEDPLRVLRLGMFKSRYLFAIAPETLELCKQMVKDGMLNHLTPERIWNEIEKALHTPNFHEFILFLDEIDALQVIFPELAALKDVPENVIYHPEGNAFKHTILTLKQVYNCFFEMDPIIEMDITQMPLLNFGLMCHDFGKQDTVKDEWPAHHGHDLLGLSRVDRMCERLKIPNVYQEHAWLACRYHMKYYEFMKSKKKTQFDFVHDVTDNFRYFDRLTFLHRVHRCDLCGREGTIAPERLENYWTVTKRMNTIFSIMNGVTLKDLPEKKQQELMKYKGIVFGQRYREAMISYMKHELGRRENVQRETTGGD